ncbi:MAG: hypothetical protein LBG09_01170 [Puniceicoccales bacterium]|nr:hypothetical protein [Puniceicoccales bacterium]
MGKVNIGEVVLALLSCSGVSLSQKAHAEGEIAEARVLEETNGIVGAEISGGGVTHVVENSEGFAATDTIAAAGAGEISTLADSAESRDTDSVGSPVAVVPVVEEVLTSEERLCILNDLVEDTIIVPSAEVVAADNPVSEIADNPAAAAELLDEAAVKELLDGSAAEKVRALEEKFRTLGDLVEASRDTDFTGSPDLIALVDEIKASDNPVTKELLDKILQKETRTLEERFRTLVDLAESRETDSVGSPASVVPVVEEVSTSEERLRILNDLVEDTREPIIVPVGEFKGLDSSVEKELLNKILAEEFPTPTDSAEAKEANSIGSSASVVPVAEVVSIDNSVSEIADNPAAEELLDRVVVEESTATPAIEPVLVVSAEEKSDSNNAAAAEIVAIDNPVVEELLDGVVVEESTATPAIEPVLVVSAVEVVATDNLAAEILAVEPIPVEETLVVEPPAESVVTSSPDIAVSVAPAPEVAVEESIVASAIEPVLVVSAEEKSDSNNAAAAEVVATDNLAAEILAVELVPVEKTLVVEPPAESVVTSSPDISISIAPAPEVAVGESAAALTIEPVSVIFTAEPVPVDETVAEEIVADETVAEDPSIAEIPAEADEADIPVPNFDDSDNDESDQDIYLDDIENEEIRERIREIFVALRSSHPGNRQEARHNVAKFVINYPKLINRRYGKNGIALIHAAAAAGDGRLIRFLVRNGADVFLKTGTGQTALCGAVRNGHEMVTRYLVKRGLSYAEALVEDPEQAYNLSLSRFSNLQGLILIDVLRRGFEQLRGVIRDTIGVVDEFFAGSVHSDAFDEEEEEEEAEVEADEVSREEGADRDVESDGDDQSEEEKAEEAEEAEADRNVESDGDNQDKREKEIRKRMRIARCLNENILRLKKLTDQLYLDSELLQSDSDDAAQQAKDADLEGDENEKESAVLPEGLVASE